MNRYVCASAYNTSATAWEVLGGGLGIITATAPTVVGSGTAVVAAIGVAWQPSDLSLFPVEVRPTDVVPTLTTTISSNDKTPTASAPSVESSSPSTGECTRIGVASSIFCLLIIGALILVL